ncbi:MAG: hypothetical protein JWQ81_8316 [Amycolatopsis sp.]|uniref:hypothetical protein n=1 Tax=Amycolatopsis sp. TaxID=37632 RepID=UPI0026218CD2|nr:hypothetical protein [Amycolatopsis sp.]MCU1687577.1 hypothetical protein [Amycolatopsis sp.]
MSSGEKPPDSGGSAGSGDEPENPAGQAYEPSAYRAPAYQPPSYGSPKYQAPSYTEAAYAESEPAVEAVYRSAPPPDAVQRVQPHAKPWNPQVRRRLPRRIGCVLVGVLVLLGGASGFIYRMLNRPAPVASSSRTSSPPTPSTPPPAVVVSPVVRGWQSVAGGQGAYAYDVPPNWKPEPRTVHGWEADSTGPATVLSASAFYLDGYCPGQPTSKRGGSGVMTAKVGDSAMAATQVATEVALHRYTDGNGPRPTLAVGKPQPAEMSFDDGKEGPATITMIDVTSASTGACSSQRALVGAIAPTSAKDKQCVVLVAYADQSFDRPTTSDQLLQILRSYRSVPAADRTTVPATPVPSHR